MINILGPENVSNHSNLPTVLNTIDIQRKSGIEQDALYEAILRLSRRVGKQKTPTGNEGPIDLYLPPGGSEKANHIEITQ